MSKFAKGAMVTCELLLGTMYGSDGLTITEFTCKTGGGYEYTFHTDALVNAVAMVERNVVRSAVVISRPSPLD